VALHGLARRPEGVHVEPVDAHVFGVGARVVVRAQPGDEVAHVGVAPHPRREAREPGQRLLGARVGAEPAHVGVHARALRPVALDGHGAEPLLAHEPLGDAHPLAVELVRAVRALAEQHDARVADEGEQRVVVVGPPGQRMCRAAHGRDGLLGGRRPGRVVAIAARAAGDRRRDRGREGEQRAGTGATEAGERAGERTERRRRRHGHGRRR
jgi:hypothetical protein